MALGAAAVLCAYFPIAAEQTSVTTAPAAVVPELLKNYVPLTTEMFVKPKADNWITYRNNYGLWGYSALKQVHAGNVASLKMVWSRAMEDGPQEVEPYVYNGVMFLYHARDIVQALDATTGDLLWEYKRKLPANIGSTTGSINRYRNLALYADKVFIATQDAYLVALDAKTGQMVWETKRGDYMDKVAATAGPVVVEGKLITGTRCDPSSPLSGGCYVTAHDARNGEEVWRVHTIAKPGEAGGDTWGDLPVEERKHASAWMVGSYDPELKLVYWGTGVTGLGRDVLFGKGNPDLLYTNSTLAVDAITGKRVWYYQHLPRDYRDLDHAFERMIVETSVAPDPREVPWINPRLKPGERRKVITGIPGKTGIVWTLDAKTGEFLWARPTTPQTVMTGVDLATGKPIVNEPNPPADGDDNPVISCPHLFGGKNQPSGAYSPDTNAMYMPLQRVQHHPRAAHAQRADWIHLGLHDLRARGRPRDGEDRPARGYLGLHGKDDLEVRAARPDVQLRADHRRQSRLQRRLRAPLPRVQRRERQDPLGDDPERTGHGAACDLQRGGPAVRGCWCRRELARLGLLGPHARAEEHRWQQRALRLRPARLVGGLPSSGPPAFTGRARPSGAWQPQPAGSRRSPPSRTG